MGLAAVDNSWPQEVRVSQVSVTIQTQSAPRHTALLRPLGSFLRLLRRLVVRSAPAGKDQSLCTTLPCARGLVGQPPVATWPGEPPTCSLCQRRLLAGERAVVGRLDEQDVLACPLCAVALDRHSRGASIDPSEFHAPEAGRIVTTPEGYAAFVPAPLPAEADVLAELVMALSRADAALGELAGVDGQLPDPRFLDGLFKRQEALCSSRIEGAEVSLSDLLLDQVGAARAEVPRDHLREVRSCIATLRYGVGRLRARASVARAGGRASRVAAARRDQQRTLAG